ncbi:MAG TPA: recombinase family protein, partial [Symbiobacteriaceae bacterium]|nr:recombinase family protein [Symbiobacteriaceae bacterium]
MSVLILLIVIYLRVSTEEQAKKGYSLPEQRELCRKKARAIAEEHERSTGQRVELQLTEYVDDFGGDIAERPVLEEVREFVRNRRPAWFVCMDPDRFSRSLKLQLIVADDIEGQGTRIAFVQQDYDPDDMMSRAFFQFRGLMAELDKAKIVERTSRGKRGKVRAGG